jgi:two-component system, LytTR family, response regulator
MIRATIIDDEAKSIATLQGLIEEYCDGIKVVSTANSVAAGIDAVQKSAPDIVFLDIEMTDGDGFEVLKALPEKKFEVVFTTAYHDYALRAFEFSALHYLLKPVDPDELNKAVYRYGKLHNHVNQAIQYDILHKGLSNEFRRIALPSLQGITFIDLDDIVRCEAADSYTIFYLRDKSRITVSKSLNKYEKLLDGSFFCRIHDKHLINLKFVSKYVRGKGGNVVLTNGFSVDVSVRRKEEFLEKMAQFARSV